MSKAFWDQWQFDFEAAKQLAQKSKKPILLQFHRDPCAGCKKLYAETYPDTLVQKELFSWFVPLRLDILKDRRIRAQYSAVWTPSFYLLDYKGKPYFSMAGFLNAEDFRVVLRLALSEYLIPKGKYDEAKTHLQEGLNLFPDNPRAAALLFRIGMIEYLQTWDNKKFRAIMTQIKERYPHSAEARQWPWME